MIASFDPSHEPPQSPHDLVRFHARHKLLLMAHAPAAVSRLGRIVARAGTGDFDGLWQEYANGFRLTLMHPPSRGGHVNALLHAAGYFRGVADNARRADLTRAIEQYAAGATSIATPIRLIRELARQYDIVYLIDQVYFQPSVSFDER